MNTTEAKRIVRAARREVEKRQKAGESLTRIAQDCGISSAWVIRFMRGDFDNPGIYTLAKLFK